MTNSKCDLDLLYGLGWIQGYQHFGTCRICHESGMDFFGWRSPAYSFYHDGCLFDSKKYASMVKRAKKQESLNVV